MSEAQSLDALSIGEVVGILREIAPESLAESWDSNRLICGDPEAPCRKLLLAVDPAMPVVEEAVATGADLIITHHPLFLRGTDNVAATTDKGRRIHTLIREGIALANAHTSWDSAHGGVADALAAAVGLHDTVVMSPSPADPQQGIGRVGNLEQPLCLRDFAQRVAQALPQTVPGILVGGDPDVLIERVAVSGGSGDSLLGTARSLGADVYVTADLRHHPATDHLADGKPYLICATHWASEWVGLPPLAERLREEAAKRGRGLEVQVSTLVTDAWTFRLG